MSAVVNIQQSERGVLLLDAPDAIARQIVNTGATQVEIRVIDPRDISSEQRRKAWSLLGEISRWSCGYTKDKELLHEDLKHYFCLDTGAEPFSLADCDMTTARLYITYLIDFCVHHGVPTPKPLYAFCDDLEAYVYQCLASRKCAVHNRPGADIHHCTGSRVGMGRDRRTIIHTGLACLPLCRECHDLCHMGEQDFLSKHHLMGLPLDKWLCQRLGLNTVAT